ncbi:hypothetical protein AB0I60_19690 [Actinosynnema sp. NPDC050436]|uniref:hypothetical protein n=1 Tax=Actinosynnema sp. NPDC050436 TaxID=3155659 RepID=UPI0033F3000C
MADDAPALAVVAWAVVLFVAGIGIGLAFPHLSVAAMSSTDDPAEGAKAAALTTRLIAYAVTSAVAGTLLNAGGAALADSARVMTFGLAALGVVTSVRATRR